MLGFFPEIFHTLRDSSTPHCDVLWIVLRDSGKLYKASLSRREKSVIAVTAWCGVHSWLMDLCFFLGHLSCMDQDSVVILGSSQFISYFHTLICWDLHLLGGMYFESADTIPAMCLLLDGIWCALGGLSEDSVLIWTNSEQGRKNWGTLALEETTTGDKQLDYYNHIH